MKRRNALATLGSTLVAGLAGCSGSTTDNAETTPEPTPTSSPTPTKTPTETPTPLPTPTASPTPEPIPTHDVTQAFEVGSGARTIQYAVLKASSVNEVGPPSFAERAAGRFVVVSLSMENVGQESLDITTRPFQLVDGEGRLFDSDSAATAMLGQDDRFNIEGLSFVQLQPGLRVRRGLVFDVNPDASYGLLIRPAGLFSTASEHIVRLGRVE